MSAGNEVHVEQNSSIALFRFDDKVLGFRNACVTRTADGMFIRFYVMDNHTVSHILSNSQTMTKQELLHAMTLIRDEYDLYDNNKDDINRIIDALNTDLYHGRDDDEMDGDDRIYHLIEAADKCRKEIVLCLLGKPGIGKTEAVERFAKDHGRKVVHIIASQILPSEVSGMTMPNQETRSMDIFDHYRLSHMRDGDILFFDELLKGQQQVLNACLTLIQERRLMSGTKLPDVLVIAAANPLATPLQLPLEIRQRFMFVEVEWNRMQWVEYMKALGFEKNQPLYDLSHKIEAMLDRDDSWNTLTPRTATKLCLWLRDSGNDLSVRDFIVKAFGPDEYRLIKGAVLGSDIKSAKVQTAERIIDILAPIYSKPEYSAAPEKLDEALDAAQAVAEERTTDLDELLSKLQALPEWGEIQKALSASKIEREKITY